MVERDQAPAPFRRRDFGDVNRRNENGATDGHPAENPRADKDRKMNRQRRDQRGCDKENRRANQDLFPPEPVTEETRDGGAA